MHKEKIKKSFNRAANSYDEFSYPQQIIGSKLIYALKNHILSANYLVDFGCGTGLVTEKLAQQIIYQKFQAIDFSPDLYEKAKIRLLSYGITCLNQDFDHCEILPNSIDVIFSNMALHWAQDFSRILKRIHLFLNKGGVLAFTVPLEGTYSELSNSKNKFYLQGQVIAYLLENGFTILSDFNQDLVMDFCSWIDALRSIKFTGSNYQFNKANKSLQKAIPFKGDPKLTYSIGYFIARKE